MIHYKVRNNISVRISQSDISLQILKQHKNSKTSFQFLETTLPHSFACQVCICHECILQTSINCVHSSPLHNSNTCLVCHCTQKARMALQLTRNISGDSKWIVTTNLQLRTHLGNSELQSCPTANFHQNH
jgi:hypothetical protein